MDLGRFEISKGPSNRGGLDLGLFSKSNQPSRKGGLDLGLFEKSNRLLQRRRIPFKITYKSLENLIFALSLRPWRAFIWQRPSMCAPRKIPRGVCDLVYCGAGCLGLSRGGLDLGLFRKSNRPSGRGGLDLGLFSKSNRPSRRGGLDIGLSKRANPNRRGGVVQSDVRIMRNQSGEPVSGERYN